MDRLIARAGLACGVLAFIIACFMSLSGDWSGLFSREAASRILELLTSFFPPESDPAFLRKAAYATLETLAISWIGTLLATMAGLFCALPAAGLWGAVPKGITRMLLNALRAVPELVWAALLVIADGRGPFPGTCAGSAHDRGAGTLVCRGAGNAPREPYLALRRHGVGSVVALSYGLLPQITPQLTSLYAVSLGEQHPRCRVLGVVALAGWGNCCTITWDCFIPGNGADSARHAAPVGLVDNLQQLAAYARMA